MFVFEMHTDMTTVTIQSNKIVSNEVKDNEVLQEPCCRKNQTNFLANPVIEYGGKLNFRE